MISIPLGIATRSPLWMTRWKMRCSISSDETVQKRRTAADDVKKGIHGSGVEPSLDDATPLSDAFDSNVVEMDSAISAEQHAALWRGAIKIPMYWVAVIPVLVCTCGWMPVTSSICPLLMLLFQVGAAAAYYETGLFAMARTARLLFGSLCVIGWLNLRCWILSFED